MIVCVCDYIVSFIAFIYCQFFVYSATKKSADIFQIIRDEERSASTPAQQNTKTVSSFASRVSSGTTRRCAITSGDFYIDLKIYKVEDVKTTDALERYKKALVAIKLQCEEKSVEWEQIQKFISTAFDIFKNCEPTYYSNSYKK